MSFQLARLVYFCEIYTNNNKNNTLSFQEKPNQTRLPNLINVKRSQSITNK